MTASVAQWGSSIMFIAIACLAIPLSMISDILGQIYTNYIYTIIQAGSQLGCALTKNFYLYLFFKFLFGDANAGATAAKNTILRKFPKNDEAHQMILKNQALVNGMAVISPLICGVLIDVNWRVIHYCSAAFYFLTIFTTIPFGNTERTHFKHFDWLGTLMLFISIILIDVSFTIISAQEYVFGAVMLVVGIGLFVGLVYVEKC